ncbi:hypothetical protein Tco_1414220 [Tanacetum coccineum]
MIKTMKKSFAHQSQAQQIFQAINDTFDKGVFPRVEEAIRIIREEMHKKTTSVKDDFRSLITTELATTALNHIEELFQRYMQTHADHDDHPGGPPGGDKNAKKQKTTRSTKSVKGVSSSKQSIQGSEAPSLTQWQDFDAWYEVQEVDDEEIKINLTALTLVILCIEALKPNTISINPFIGIVYENILLDANHGLKDPPLSENYKKGMEIFKKNIKERLKFIRQIRRWESCVNERPLLRNRELPE